jgi:hypothetical protein
MIVGDRIDSLKKRVTGADGIAALLRVLEELQRLEPEHENGEELDDLRLDAFDALARLTRATPHEAGPIIVRYLVPLCLRSRGEWRVPHVARRYDEALSSWLDRFPLIDRYAPRARVLEVIEPAIGGARHREGSAPDRDTRLPRRTTVQASAGPRSVR